MTDYYNFRAQLRNFARECQSTWSKNFLPYIRFVATVKVSVTVQNSGPEVLFKTCVAMKSVDDDDDEGAT